MDGELEEEEENTKPMTITDNEMKYHEDTISWYIARNVDSWI